MTEAGKSQIRMLASAAAGFVLVVGLGAVLMMPQGGSAKAPPASFAAPAAPRPPEPVSLALPAPGPADVIEQRTAAAASPAAAATSAPAAETRSAQARPSSLVVVEHLDATQTTSAKASVAALPEARPAAAAPRPQEFNPPKLAAPKNGGVAVVIHYGVRGRSELMGRAAGPVYNFKGGGAKKSQAPAAGLGQMATQMEEAARQVEGSSLDDAAKKDLRERFQLVNDGIGKTGSN